MPYCSVCKSYADYEYNMSLSDGRFLHESCLLKLQIRKDELESATRSQKTQLILSLFFPNDAAKADAASKADADSLSIELNKVKSELTSIYDTFISYPPDWDERKKQVIANNGAICFRCAKEGQVYLQHEISVFEGGTNALDNLHLVCTECHADMYGTQDLFGKFTLKPAQFEFAEQVTEIQHAMGSGWKIQFGYKKPSAKTYMTRVVVPERLLNMPNSRDSGLCVEGFCELRQDTRVFALERMQALEVVED